VRGHDAPQTNILDTDRAQVCERELAMLFARPTWPLFHAKELYAKSATIRRIHLFSIEAADRHARGIIASDGFPVSRHARLRRCAPVRPLGGRVQVEAERAPTAPARPQSVSRSHAREGQTEGRGFPEKR